METIETGRCLGSATEVMLHSIPSDIAILTNRCRLSLLAALALLFAPLQGCVAWPYATTPIVTGRVIDADTRKPVVDAEVGFRKHEGVTTRTKADGNYRLTSDHKWGPAFILPLEFTPSGGVFYAAAPGYVTFEKDLGRHAPYSVQLPDVELRKVGSP